MNSKLKALVLVAIVAAVPVSVKLVQQQQDTRSRAAGVVGKPRVETVCQLTGLNNSNVSNVKGTDLGFTFSHKGKLYFVFGDTNTRSAEPGNSLSNILAYSEGKDEKGCFKLRYITVKDVYEPAKFYAQESNFQAGEEIKVGGEIGQYIFKDYQGHYDWGKSQSKETVRNELGRKLNEILEFYSKRGWKELADYYARTAVRLNQLGVDYRDETDQATLARNFLDYQIHYGWVMEDKPPLGAIWSEIMVRMDRIFRGMEGDLAKQMMPSKVAAEEVTLIPTGGISVNGKIYMFYMSIKEWSTPWKINYSGVAVSDDDGLSFRRTDNLFGAESNFGQIFPFQMKNKSKGSGLEDILDLGYVYFMGIPAGRSGGAKLGRVGGAKIEDRSAYRFCKLNRLGGCAWVENENEASMILEAPVAEISIAWNNYLSQWTVTYLNDNQEIVWRTADKPWGLWSTPERLFKCEGEFKNCYGGLIGGDFQEDGGRVVYFNTSVWEKYNVWLMKAVFEKLPETSTAPVASTKPEASPEGETKEEGEMGITTGVSPTPETKTGTDQFYRFKDLLKRRLR